MGSSHPTHMVYFVSADSSFLIESSRVQGSEITGGIPSLPGGKSLDHLYLWFLHANAMQAADERQRRKMVLQIVANAIAAIMIPTCSRQDIPQQQDVRKKPRAKKPNSQKWLCRGIKWSKRVTYVDTPLQWAHFKTCVEGRARKKI